jgi:hypothetical protein
MWKAISALIAAAAIAGAVTLFPGLSEDVVARTTIIKGDRADAMTCERQGWPYYQNDCLKDLSRNAGRATPARLITTDRVYAEPSAPLPEWAAYLPALHPAASINFAAIAGARTQ